MTKMPVIDNKGFELARPFLEETSQALMQSFMEAWQNKMSDTKITPDDEGIPLPHIKSGFMSHVFAAH